MDKKSANFLFYFLFLSPIYNTYFGGVTLIPKDKYIKANGYSNLYFGWGGEGNLNFSYSFI